MSDRPLPAPFLVGANLPWISYGGDFGASPWHPNGGLTRPEVSARARQVLGSLAEAGTRSVRWFVLADGRAGLRFDRPLLARGAPVVPPDGRLLGLDDRFFADFDEAVRLLRATGLSAVFVLLDFAWFSPPRLVNGVWTGGHTSLVRRRAARRHLLETVIAPILDRYGHDVAILAWEVINEPEWATTRRPWPSRWRLSRRSMRAFIRDVVALVHSRTCQMATVGCASAATLRLVAGLGLDFYQVHWYEHLACKFDPAQPVSRLRAGAPVLLGEFPTRGAGRSPAAIIEAAHRSGYAGAFGWSAVREDRVSDVAALEAGVRAWSMARAQR